MYGLIQNEGAGAGARIFPGARARDDHYERKERLRGLRTFDLHTPAPATLYKTYVYYYFLELR